MSYNKTMQRHEFSMEVVQHRLTFYCYSASDRVFGPVVEFLPRASLRQSQGKPPSSCWWTFAWLLWVLEVHVHPKANG
jgi:hypothetical protein